MFITADQIVAHLIGDYIVQSTWQAQKKTSQTVVAMIHAVTYTLPFLFLTRSPWSLLWICGTHFMMDRFRLARYLCWAKNQLAPASYRYPLSEAGPSGYHKDDPVWLATWLLIIADNTMHLVLNAAAIKFFCGW